MPPALNPVPPLLPVWISTRLLTSVSSCCGLSFSFASNSSSSLLFPMPMLRTTTLPLIARARADVLVLCPPLARLPTRPHLCCESMDTGPVVPRSRIVRAIVP